MTFAKDMYVFALIIYISLYIYIHILKIHVYVGQNLSSTLVLEQEGAPKELDVSYWSTCKGNQLDSEWKEKGVCQGIKHGKVSPLLGDQQPGNICCYIISLKKFFISFIDFIDYIQCTFECICMSERASDISDQNARHEWGGEDHSSYRVSLWLWCSREGFRPL